MVLILGSDNLLIRATDDLVSVLPSPPFSCLDLGREGGADRRNLFVAEWLPLFNLLVFEAFGEPLDPTEAVLMGNLRKGEDDLGSESLNFDLL